MWRNLGERSAHGFRTIIRQQFFQWQKIGVNKINFDFIIVLIVGALDRQESSSGLFALQNKIAGNTK